MITTDHSCNRKLFSYLGIPLTQPEIRPLMGVVGGDVSQHRPSRRREPLRDRADRRDPPGCPVFPGTAHDRIRHISADRPEVGPYNAAQYRNASIGRLVKRDNQNLYFYYST